MADPILSLSTEVHPPQVFEVDGEEYQLLGLQHLNEDDESRATAAFARFGILLQRLAESPSDQEASRFAKLLRRKRIELITMLTTLPKDVAEKLPISAQGQLFRTIQQETGQQAEDIDGDGALD